MNLKFILYFLVLLIPFFFLTLWAIVDVARKDFETQGKKAMWWIVASIPFIGFLPYFLFGARKGKKIT